MKRRQWKHFEAQKVPSKKYGKNDPYVLKSNVGIEFDSKPLGGNFLGSLGHVRLESVANVLDFLKNHNHVHPAQTSIHSDFSVLVQLIADRRNDDHVL